MKICGTLVLPPLKVTSSRRNPGLPATSTSVNGAFLRRNSSFAELQ
jgi:hypothetical protein